MKEGNCHEKIDSNAISTKKAYTEQPAQTYETTKDNAFPYVVFGVPIVIVILMAVFKHVVWRIPNIREGFRFLLEISIDVLAVGATILFANYYRITSPAAMFWIIVYLLIVMVISLIIRALNIDGKLNGNKVAWIFVSPVMCIIAIIWLYYLVC